MPSIELKEHVGCSKKYRVEIEQERLDEQIKATVKDLKKDVQVPGFRKGRAPEEILIRRFGPTIRQEAVKELIPKALAEVFESEGVDPVNDPDIGDLDYSDSGPISFTVTIEEIPEVDISGFEGLHVTKQVREVTDEIVETEIERIQRMYAKQEEVDREIRNGDILVVNLQKLDASGVPIIGDKMEDHVIVLDGQSTPSPDFDEQVEGMKKGERKTVRFTYDESINNPELVGQTDAYDVEIVRVIENKIPELDNEFLEQLGNFENVEDLKERTRDRLVRQYESSSESKLHRDLVEEFVKQYPFEVPNSMVERIIYSEIGRIRQANPEAQFDEQEYRTHLRPDAVRAVQSYIIVDAVKKRENIEVTKEETDERLESFASINGMEAKEFRRRLIKENRFEEFKNDIANENAYNWIVGIADVAEERVSAEPERQSDIITP